MYVNLLKVVEDAWQRLNGNFRLYDMGSDTDGYIDVVANKGKLRIEGRLGAAFSSHSLCFCFEADQTLLLPLMQSLTIKP